MTIHVYIERGQQGRPKIHGRNRWEYHHDGQAYSLLGYTEEEARAILREKFPGLNFVFNFHSRKR